MARCWSPGKADSKGCCCSHFADQIERWAISDSATSRCCDRWFGCPVDEIDSDWSRGSLAAKGRSILVR